MNRAGLAIALAIAAVVGVVFAVFPRLDLDLAALFFDRKRDIFTGNAQLWMYYLRDAARGLVVLLVAPAFIATLNKLVLPRWRMLIEGRAALFLAVTLALGPGVVTNLIFKDHWGRPRPIDVTEFGGSDRFMPWWDPRGPCANNCSFVAGEPSERSGRWRRRRWRRRHGVRSPMGRRSPLARGSGSYASAAARISSPTSCSPGCSCFSWFGPCTA
jgi:lipid A 4'-phosphatase